MRAVQKLLVPLSVRFQADHLVREPLEPLRQLGFNIVELERLCAPALGYAVSASIQVFVARREAAEELGRTAGRRTLSSLGQ